MAKKSNQKTQNKELKPQVQDKKEVAKSFPSTEMVKIKLFKDNKIYTVENSTAKAIVQARRGELV